MASKQGYCADLRTYLDKRLRVRLNGNRIITGRLRGYDPFMNLVLEDTTETIMTNKSDSKNNKIEIKSEAENMDLEEDKGKEVEIGTIMIRGNSIILWECIDKIGK